MLSGGTQSTGVC